MTTEAAIMADFVTKPYRHQLHEFEVSAELPARALLWQMRTGKTKVVIDTACHLAREGDINAVLVFAPNGVHENWLRRELLIHHWREVQYSTLVWRTSIAGGASAVTKSGAALNNAWWSQSWAMLKTEELTWFAFNSESMTRDDVRKLVSRIVKYRRTMVVFDESHDFRSPGSKRTKMARALAKRCEYRRILTGTPVTNSPLHAFSQFELLESEALGHKRFDDFKDRYAEYKKKWNRSGRHYPVLTKYKNLDELKERMAPWSSVLLREDCEDLPELVRRAVPIELTEGQQRVYRELHEQFTIEIEGEEVSVGENTARLIKLQQIVSGFIIDEFGEVHDIPGGNPRLDILSEEVYMSSGKVIVWCQFREDMDRVINRLIDDGHEVLQYHGRTSDSDKARTREFFAPGADNNVKALVGHPKSGGQGLDLSAADKIIWYSHTFDAIVRGQADERATEIGGGNVEIVDLVSGGVDKYILKNVTKKVSVAKDLVGRGMRDILKRIEL